MLIPLIQQAITSRRLSVRAAAREIGIAHTTLFRILEGSPMDVDTIVLVCKWLGVPPAQALGLSGADPLVEGITALLAANPALHGALSQLLAKVQNAALSAADLEDVLAYITFKMQCAGKPARKEA